MNQQKIEKLKVLVEKGKWPYVLKHGVLFWGLPTAVFWSVIMYFMDGTPVVERLFIALVVFPICGFFLGLLNWFFINRELRKLEQQEL